jgi:phosphatidylserine/phosphatidylglycerophosphate/cardiolipin synthase-like enzyme
MFDTLHRIPSASLNALADSLESGKMSAGISYGAIEALLGEIANPIHHELQALISETSSTKAAACVLRNITFARQKAADPSLLFDLVLSGPDVPGVPTSDTSAVMASIMHDVKESLLIVGYAVHQGTQIFKSLAGRMASDPDLEVTLCIDIPRRYGDTSLASEIVRRYAFDFRKRNWPWGKSPKLFYDPRSLLGASNERSSLHAKVMVADASVAFISSANLTEAAQKRNIEAGVLIKHAPFAKRVCDYFEGLIAAGELVPFELPRFEG